jgi:hypothetical protein
MGKVVAQWTDARLNDLAAALEPVPAKVAVLDATVRHVDHLAAALEPVPAQLAVLTATVDRLGSRGGIDRCCGRNHRRTRLTTGLNMAPGGRSVGEP